MKRLIKKGDAARLHEISIDSQMAIQVITTKEKGFTQDKIIKDSGASKFAYWGAISDDGRYLVEAYMFEGIQGQRRVAFVIAPIVNGQLQTNLQATCYNIDSASEIRNIAKSGILTDNGEKLTFQNEYSSLDQLPQAEQSEEQVPKVAKKKC